jgi:hypothetical protein
MSFEQTWAVRLEEAAAGLDADLRIVDGGRVRCAVGLWAAFYFHDGHTRQVRERIVQVWESYRDAVGDVLVWGGDPKSGRAKKVQGSPILDVRSWMPRLSSQDDFEPAFHGGASKDEASSYQFSALAQTSLAGDLSAVCFAVPLSWAAPRPQGAYLSLVTQAASMLHAVHGYAGLGIALSLLEHGKGDDMSYAVPLAKRFRGLELDFPGLQTDFLREGIKGINWLTVLADAWVAKLGGLEALRAALGAENPVHEYPGGVVIQAGPHPLLGDLNRAEPMPNYEKVAAVLKPIRVSDMDALAPWHGLDRTQTADWLARFDKEK